MGRRGWKVGVRKRACVFGAAAGELGGGRARASGSGCGRQELRAGSFDTGGPCGARSVGKTDVPIGEAGRVSQRQGQGQLFGRWGGCGDEIGPTFSLNLLAEWKATSEPLSHCTILCSYYVQCPDGGPSWAYTFTQYISHATILHFCRLGCAFPLTVSCYCCISEFPSFQTT